MDAIRTAIARARLRLIAQAVLHWWGWLLLAAAGLCALVVGGARLFALAMPVWVYIGIVAAAVVSGPVVAWLRRPGAAHVAAVLDERLGLKDRLGTALFARTLGDEPMARHVVAEAGRAAQGLRVTPATPVQLGRVWAAVPAVGAVAVALAMGLPEYDVLGLDAQQRQREAEQREAEREQQRLAEAGSRLREMAGERRPDQAADADELIEQIAALTERELANPETQRELRARISDVRERLDEAAEQRERELRSFRNALSQLETEEHGPADPFTDALRRGDFGEAQRELGRLAGEHERGELSESDQQLLQRQFEQMSEQLGEIGEDAQQQHEQTRESMREQLREQGLSEDEVDELENRDFDREAVRDVLQEKHRDRGMDEQEARERAEQQADRTERQRRESERQRERAEDSERLGEGMGEMADSLGEQREQGEQGEQREPGEQREQTAEPGEAGEAQAEQAQQTEQAEQGGEAGQQADAQQADEQQQGAGQAGSEDDRFQQEAWEGQRQLEDMQEREAELERIARAQEALDEAMGDGGSPQPADASEVAGAGDAAGQDPQAGQAGQGGPGDPGGERGQGQGEGAMAGGGGVGGHEGGTGAGGTMPGDADEPHAYDTTIEHDPRLGRGRVIASWMSEGEAAPGESERDFDRAVTEARDEADRAVAEDRVPRRYHGSIREYFEQLPESVEEEE